MKLKLVIFLTLLISALIFGIFLVASNKSQPLSTPIAPPTFTPTASEKVTLKRLKEFNDPAGFSFKYPDSVKVNQKLNTDQSTFSSLNIASDKNLGNIKVEVTASDLKSVDEWSNTNKTTSAKSLSSRTKIKLADLDAIQYQENGKLITVAVDVGTLFKFTTDWQNNKDFWFDVNNAITTTFAFKPPEIPNENAPETGGDGDVIFEGEETIE